MAKIVIAGAGMAGLLAGCMLMNNHDVMVVEARSSLPHNHHALLRFRSDIVSTVLGIPFKKVEVCKAIFEPTNPLSDAVSYSLKVNGRPSFRSILSANGEVETRYIAPPDLIERMAKRLGNRISFSCPVLPPYISTLKDYADSHVITTAPMSANLKLVYGEPEAAEMHPEFNSRSGIVVSCDLSAEWDFYSTLYFPRPDTRFYRGSITGKKIILESTDFTDEIPTTSKAISWIEQFMVALGMEGQEWLIDTSTVEVKKQPYAKIIAIDENFRKSTIMELSKDHNLHSLGRFATWRPGLLLDDVVNDVRVIESIILGNPNSQYKSRKGN
jgi:hypothetical protein